MAKTSSADEATIQVRLASFFPEEDIEWKPQRFIDRDGGRALMLAYVSNRAIQHRLDDVMGVAGWRNEYVRWGEKGVLCGLSLYVMGTWITKWDGADESDIESTKGGLSNAMKRAAVQWGIGRYLYELPSQWVAATVKAKGNGFTGFVKDQDLPKLPAKWLPAGAPESPPAASKPKAGPKPRPEPEPQPAGEQAAEPVASRTVQPQPAWLDDRLPSRDFSGETWRDALKGSAGGRHHVWLAWMAQVERLKPRNEGDESPTTQMWRARDCMYVLRNGHWPTAEWSWDPALLGNLVPGGSSQGATASSTS